MSPESGRTGKPRIALTGDSDVLIRVLNEQYIFINYVISSIILVYLCELFQSKRLVWTVSRLPELNIENLWYYRDDRHPHTGVIFSICFSIAMVSTFIYCTFVFECAFLVRIKILLLLILLVYFFRNHALRDT